MAQVKARNVLADILRVSLVQRRQSWLHTKVVQLMDFNTQSQPLTLHQPRQRRSFCTSIVPSKEARIAAALKPKIERIELLLRGMREFYEREGHFIISSKFVVPSDSDWPVDLHGFKLGERVRTYVRGIMNPKKYAQLKSIGFPAEDWKSYTWEYQLLPSLRVFASIEGHTFVRIPVVIALDDERYPKCARGHKLGLSVSFLRQQYHSLTEQQHQQLREIDFLWSEGHYRLKQVLIPGLREFKNIFGHTDVPHRFIIPNQAGWEQPIWSKGVEEMKLGYIYTSFNSGFYDEKTVAYCKNELEELNVLDKTKVKQDVDQVWTSIVLPALVRFPIVFGHHDIPKTFIVPKGDANWPKETWGYRLGYALECILEHQLFAEQILKHKPELRSAGYRWNQLYGKWSKQFLPALRRYHEKYGHSKVPLQFSVPVNDPEWPKDTHGFHLGRHVQTIRKIGRDAKDVVDVLEELDALGFDFDPAETEFLEIVLPSLKVFVQMYGHCDVPRGFIIPSPRENESTEWLWPMNASGFRLGTAVHAIRHRTKHFKRLDDYRTQLNELGFLWPSHQTSTQQTHILHRQRAMGVEDVSSSTSEDISSCSTPSTPVTYTLDPHLEQYWNDVVMASFRTYFAQHGSCRDMPTNFVVPSVEPYPQITWGLNLGLRLRYIRHHNRYAAEITKYRDELVHLGVLE